MIFSHYCLSQKDVNRFDSTKRCKFSFIRSLVIFKTSSIVDLNTDTLFVDIGDLSVEILILEIQICCHLETRTLVIWCKQIPEAHRNQNRNQRKLKIHEF